MQEFRDKRMMGHAFRRCGFKIKVKWKGIGKKKRQFSGLLFFYRSLKLVHLHIFLPRLQYSYEARFTMSTYLCIQCAQSFTLEHYFAGSLFERYINRDATEGIF